MDEVQKLEARVRELEEVLRKFRLDGVNNNVGGRGSSVRHIYLEDPKRLGSTIMLSWDSANDDWRSEKVR